MASRKAVMMLVAALALVFGVSAALAQQFESNKGYYYTGDICFGGESAIADGPPQNYASVYLQNEANGACWLAQNVGEGKLALKRQLYKKVNGDWNFCVGTDWKWNTSATSFMDSDNSWGNGAPCGAGYYNSRAGGKVKYNGQTHEGHRWSGQVWFYF